MDCQEAISILTEVHNHRGSLSASQKSNLIVISELINRLHKENAQLKKDVATRSSYAAVASRNTEPQNPPTVEKTIIFKTRNGENNNNLMNCVYNSISSIRENCAVKINKVIKTKTGAIIK